MKSSMNVLKIWKRLGSSTNTQPPEWFNRIIQLFGDVDGTRYWLTVPNDALNGAEPVVFSEDSRSHLWTGEAVYVLDQTLLYHRNGSNPLYYHIGDFPMEQGVKQNRNIWANRLQIVVNVVVILGAVITALGWFSNNIPSWFEKKIEAGVQEALRASLEGKIKQQLKNMSSGIIDSISISELREDVDNLKNNTRPLAPQNLSVTQNSKGHLVLRWNKPHDTSIIGYQILRRRPEMEENQLSVYVESTANVDTTYTDSNSGPETAYVYRVKARNAAGLLSPQSNFGRYPPLE